MVKRGARTAVVFVGGVLLALVVVVAGTASAADPIKIGDFQPMTGPFEANGRAFAAGVQFVVDEQNAKGGLLGRKIEIVREDSEMKPDVAIRKAKKLILEDKVSFIANAMGSHVAIALNRVAASSKVLYFNYGAMADEIMGKEFNPYVFRVTQNVYNMNAAIVAVLATKPYRRFYSIQGDYVAGYDNDKTIKELVKKQIPDATFVGTDFHPLGTKDFAPYVTKIIASKADAVIAGNFGPDFINLVRQARAMGLKQMPIFAPLSNHPYILSELKDDAVGVYFAHEYSLRVKTPENEELIRKFHELHKNDKDFVSWWPTSDVALAVLGWKMIFAAIEKAGSVEPDKVIATFENNFQWKSPVGLWTMRKCDHQVIVPMFVGMIQAGDNPFFNGRIRPEVKFPVDGPSLVELPAARVMNPATPAYNPRCQ